MYSFRVKDQFIIKEKDDTIYTIGMKFVEPSFTAPERLTDYVWVLYQDIHEEVQQWKFECDEVEENFNNGSWKFIGRIEPQKFNTKFIFD